MSDLHAYEALLRRLTESLPHRVLVGLNVLTPDPEPRWRALWDGFLFDPQAVECRRAVTAAIADSLATPTHGLNGPAEWAAALARAWDEWLEQLRRELTARGVFAKVLGHLHAANASASSVEAMLVRLQAAVMVGEQLDLGAIAILYGDTELENVHVADLDVTADGPSGTFAMNVSAAPTIDALISAGSRFAQRMAGGIASDWSSAHPHRSPSNVFGYRVALRQVTPSSARVLIAVRFHRVRHVHMANLVAEHLLSPDMAQFLEAAVRSGRTVVVAGAPGSGKTTLVRVLSRAIPRDAHLAVLENEVELDLARYVRDENGRPWHRVLHAHVERAGTGDGAAPIRIVDLLDAVLQEDCQRVIVGETRDGATMRQLVKAANTGMSGVITTLHATSLEDIPHRVGTLLLEGGVVPDAVGPSITQGLDVLVHVARTDLDRRITGIGLVEPGELAARPIVRVLWQWDAAEDLWVRGPGAGPFIDRALEEVLAM